jgi:hypothetical protein
MLGPDGKPLQVIPIERAGDEAWAGVAAIDRGESKSNLGLSLALGLGDVTSLLAFAAIGRLNHAESVLDFETFSTAAPFLVGWMASASLLDGFGTTAQGKEGVKPAALKALQIWSLGIPSGLLIRYGIKGYLPVPFAIVSCVSTAIFLVGWRSALAYSQRGSMGKEAKKIDKQGNPFEFIELLFSLVKRW